MLEKFSFVSLLSHRTVPNEAGDHRAALNPPLAGSPGVNLLDLIWGRPPGCERTLGVDRPFNHTTKVGSVKERTGDYEDALRNIKATGRG